MIFGRQKSGESGRMHVVYVLDTGPPAEPDVRPLVDSEADGSRWEPSARYIERWRTWQERARLEQTKLPLERIITDGIEP